MKKYPMRCPYCGHEFIISKQDVNKTYDGSTSCYYYYYCPSCKNKIGEWNKDNLFNKNNIGFLDKGRAIVI